MPARKINCRGRSLDLGSHTQIMGVINCTADSFYPGSRCPDPAQATDLAIGLVEDGADILDIGGESSRPGSEPVSQQQEMDRVLPVLENVLDSVAVPVSIDTYKSSVAEAALNLGAHIINDISGLRFDPEMVSVAARYSVPVVIMHMKGKPKDMQHNPHYSDVIAEIHQFFQEQLEFAQTSGVGKEQVIIDPGLGFGKTLHDNYLIINRLNEFMDFECPILVGPSRKSFIQKVLDLPSEEAKEGTLAFASAAILKGANIIRVHDVMEMKRAAKIIDFLKELEQ